MISDLNRSRNASVFLKIIFWCNAISIHLTKQELEWTYQQ